MIFSDTCYKFFHSFSTSFLPAFNTVVNYPNTWFTRSFLLEVLIKVIEFTIKFKVFDFHYQHMPFCNFQNSVSKNVVLLNFCLCVYMIIIIFPFHRRCSYMVLVISVFLVQSFERDMASADSAQEVHALKAELDAIKIAMDNKWEELKAEMDKTFQSCQRKSKQHSYLYAVIIKWSK